MAIGQWRAWTLIRLWILAVGALLIGLADGMSAWTIGSAGSVAVVGWMTWRWLSARKPRINPLDPPRRGISELAQAIKNVIADAPDEERAAVRGLIEHVPIDNKQLAYELVGLKRAAAFLVVSGELFRSPQQAVQLMGQIDVQLASAFDRSSALNEFEKRRQEYLAAMSVGNEQDALYRVTPGAEMLTYNADPVANVGKLFAFICGSERNPLVVALGSAVFATTLQQVRTLL